MTRKPAGARRWTRRAVASIVVTVVCGGAFAQSENEALNAEGIQTGWMIFAPSLTFGYSYDTNVLQQPDSTQPPPEPDQVLTFQPALRLTIPFSNSSFSFGDVFTYVDYQHTSQTQGKTSNDAEADLTLNFGSLNQLELTAHNIAGVAETLAFDLGGEIGFQGNTYQLHTEAVTLSRLFSGIRGYRFGLQRNALRFEPTVQADFYNYRGFDGEASYFQPLSPNTRLAFGYLGSRYEHSDSKIPDVVNRTESGDTVFGQIEGQLGPRQPYIVRLGVQRLAFDATAEGSSSDDFTGIVGNINLSAIVGGGTVFTVGILRQPYRSYDQSNSFYVFNQIFGTVARLFHQGTSVGGTLGLSVNGYKQPSTQSGVTFFREDRRVQLEAHANIALAKRFAFRVSLERNRRYSNAPDDVFDYSNTVLFGGFVLGWI
jgi:hypothetical protein